MERPDHLVIFFFHKVLYLFFPVYDKGKGGRHHSPDTEQIIYLLFPGLHGISTGQVHADQPVGPFPAISGFIHTAAGVRPVQLVINYAAKRLFYRIVVPCLDIDTLGSLPVVEINKDLIDEQLPFPVRVPAVHDHIRRLQQLPDRRQLFPALGF